MSYGQKRSSADASIIGKGEIRGAESFEHLNSVYLSADRTVTSVPYYNKKKLAMQKSRKNNGVLIGLSNKDSSRGDLKHQISDSLRTHKVVDPYLNNYIKELTV